MRKFKVESSRHRYYKEICEADKEHEALYQPKVFKKLVKHKGVMVDNLRKFYGNGSMIHIPNHYFKAISDIIISDIMWVYAAECLLSTRTDIIGEADNIYALIYGFSDVEHHIENARYHLHKVRDLMEEIDPIDPNNVREEFGIEAVTNSFIAIYGDRPIVSPLVNQLIEGEINNNVLSSEFLVWWMMHHDRRQWENNRFDL
jgi:hypothetical protein